MGKIFRRETACGLRHPAGSFVTDPLEAVRLVPEGLASYFEHPVDHDVDGLWGIPAP
jgi:hypothetical protein